MAASVASEGALATEVGEVGVAMVAGMPGPCHVAATLTASGLHSNDGRMEAVVR